MNPLLDIVPQLLGIIPPALVAALAVVGIRKSDLHPVQRQRWTVGVLVSVLAWTALAWATVGMGALAYTPGELAPPFLLALALPLVAALGLLAHPVFRRMLDRVPLHLLVGAQGFRLLGSVFLLVPTAGLGPDAFTSAGYGDLATGSLAIAAALLVARKAKGATAAVWAFTAVGLFDLLNVSRILLGYYPAWTTEGPTTFAATVFPMALVPAVAAPVALALHVYVVRAVLGHRTQTTPHGSAVLHPAAS